jgi:divalent metal cation (Fe/Co/Zn/Cd) transporter
VRKARRLEYFTLAWNAAEAMVAIAAGSAAGSVALIGFGVDSVIESLSGAALLWRLRSHSHGEVRERRALRMVGWAFVALAVYVGAESGLAIARREPPAASLAGTALAAASVVVMPVLARAKRRVARRMGSAALAADARQTDLCAYLSVILLGGLALNALFGLWWADPVAGLAMVPVIAVEGLSALRGRTCSGC